MICHEDLRKILELAVTAPSGENCQPWRFEVKGNEIIIVNIPERDLSLYNFRQFGSFIAHGALIENIRIASSKFGYSCSVNTFPNQNNLNHVSTIILAKNNPNEEPLFPYIQERITNRNPYEKTPPSPAQKEELKKTVIEVGGGELSFIDDSDKKKELAKSLIISDKMLFENQKIHDFLFSHIIWDKKEAEKKRTGFFIKELALPPPIEKLFKVLGDWHKVLAFNKFGFSNLAAKGNIKLYSSSGGFGAVIIKSNKPQDFVLAGRVFQRLWLKATKMGLSIQPVTGVIFFIQRILAGETRDFSDKHVELIKNSYREIADIFDVHGRTIAMLFRIGFAKNPGVKSLRLPPDITVKG